jgi:hypothetical protein
MPHLKITNGQPETYSIGQLRRDNPNTSFPKVPSDALLADWGVYPYAVHGPKGGRSATCPSRTQGATSDRTVTTYCNRPTGWP